MSETIGIGQLRSHACHYFERVAAGETLGVMRRGRVVAWIRGCAPSGPGRPDGAIEDGLLPHFVIPVGLSQLRDAAGRYLDHVADGQTLTVVHRGENVARIESARATTHGRTRLRPERR